MNFGSGSGKLLEKFTGLDIRRDAVTSEAGGTNQPGK
jgi:hypothetical protein